MPGDLRIGRPVIGDGRRDRLRLTELVDLDDPRRDRAARGLPDEAAGKTAAEREHAEEGEPPVPGLNAGGADALVPDLAGSLIGRLGFGGRAVAHGRSPEHRLFSFREIDAAAGAGMIAGADGVLGGARRRG